VVRESCEVALDMVRPLVPLHQYLLCSRSSDWVFILPGFHFSLFFPQYEHEHSAEFQYTLPLKSV
jgi:hypothetical protein